MTIPILRDANQFHCDEISKLHAICHKISKLLKLRPVKIDLIFSFIDRAAYLSRKFLTVAARWHLCAFKLKALSSLMTLLGEWASSVFSKKKN